MLALGSWVRPFWDSDQLQPEDCGSCTDEFSLHCGKAVCTAASMISSYSVTVETPPNSPISPGKKILLIVFILHFILHLMK